MSKSLTAIPEKQVAEISSEVSPLLQEADAIVINSIDDVEQASLFLRKIKIALRNIEDKRTSFTQPINESLRNINATFKEISEPLKKADKTVGDKILKFRAEEKKRIEAEEERRRKIQESHEARGHNVSAPVELEKPSKTVGFSTAKTVWVWELEDFSKLPEKFKTVDEKALNLAVKSGIREIAGVKITEKEVLATSRF